MMLAVVAGEPHSVIHLAYGNKNKQNVLLGEELGALKARSNNQMSISHVLSRPGWWSGALYWRRGRLDKSSIEELIALHPPYAQDVQYYVCGPGGMNAAVQAGLVALGVPAWRIHAENYGGPAVADDTAGWPPRQRFL